MGITTTAGLVTVAEFERLKDPPGVRLELHHGEVVEVPPPPSDHAEIQDRIADALRAIVSAEWKIRTEFAFRPQPEYEVWEADVGVMKADRWFKAVKEKSYPLGAPELLVEVLSPSNTASEMHDRERTCIEGGCQEFCVVDPKNREVRVSTPDRVTRTYRPGERVPVALLGANATIAVDDIFKA